MIKNLSNLIIMIIILMFFSVPSYGLASSGQAVVSEAQIAFIRIDSEDSLNDEDVQSGEVNNERNQSRLPQAGVALVIGFPFLGGIFLAIIKSEAEHVSPDKYHEA